MSSTPAIGGTVSRIPDMLRSQLALGQITRTQLSLFQVQSQIATGRAVSRFSDDSAKAAAIAILDGRLERADQWQRNFDHADASLSILDKALGDANELITDAKTIASEQVGTGTTPDERAGQAQIVNSLIQNLYGIANRKSIVGHVFGGSTPGTQPIVPLLGGYRYVGQGSGLLTDLGMGAEIPVTIGGNNAIGETSARVKGEVDLDPGLTGQTRITDLKGALGTGVAMGRVEFSFDGGPHVSVDLTGCDSIADTVARLNGAIHDYEQANSVTVLGPGGVSFSGGSLTFDVPAGAPNPTLEFFDIGNGTTAKDLGLTGSTAFAFSATTAAGLDVQAKLTWQTPISALRGVTGALGSIKINNLAQSRILDFSGAQTVEDLKNMIEGAGIGMRVQIDGDRLDIVNETAAGKAQAMSIEEIAGNNLTATRLGIRSYSAETRLSDFNDGRGIQIVKDGVDPITGLPDPTRETDFSIRLGDAGSTSFTVDLRPQDIVTVQTLIDRINSEAAAAGINVPADFEARLGDGANGLVLTQNASFASPIAVASKNGSPAAEQLGLLDGTYDAASSSFRATDRAKVRLDNLFTHLIDLRDALTNNDTIGITLAGEKLEQSVDRVAQTRALVGGYAKRVTDGVRQLQDRNVLDENTRASLRDTDYAEASMRLNLLNTQLQAGLQVTASAFSRSLLDFLG